MDNDNALQHFISKLHPTDDMLWKGAWGDQMRFMRDVLVPLVGWGMHYEDVSSIPEIVSTHRSKSIILPVLGMNRPDIGLRLIVRENFYNWKLSVISERPVIADFSGLFHTTPPVEPKYTGNPLADVYFEGFPKDLVFGYYEPSDKMKWSAEISGDYKLYTTVFFILRALDVVKPYEWHTEASHRKQLDEDSARRKAREAVKNNPLSKIENTLDSETPPDDAPDR